MIDFFLKQMDSFKEKDAIAIDGRAISYSQLLAEYHTTVEWLKNQEIPEQAVVSFDGDYSTSSIALMLALAKLKAIIVPLSSDSRAHFTEFREIAITEYDISINASGLNVETTGRRVSHPLYQKLRDTGDAGLVLFSSGSTGKSKGIVQNLNALMRKFQKPRTALRMLIFLQLDHIGGMNSLLYTLANSGTLIIPSDRSPVKVCEAIQNHAAELLPTSPTFINLLMLSKAYEDFDLSSLRLVTYGTEPMQKSTLEAFTGLFPDVKVQQTYGLSEVGILRSKSKGDSSLWVKVGGEDYNIKIVDKRLFIKSNSSMLGYLNAPDPFDAQGYLDTGDIVEQDGEWLKILGRESELINVGGFKVFPAEVESVLLEIENVEDAVVFAMDNSITGKIVATKVKLLQNEPLREFKTRMRAHCAKRLQRFKIPTKIYLSDESTYNERFKRMRRMKKEWA